MDYSTSRNETRYGARTAGPWRAYQNGATITSLAAPTTYEECVRVAGGSQVQWMFRNAGGASNVTALTVHYGRWVSTPRDAFPSGHASEITGEFVEDGSVAVTGLTDDELFTIPPFNTYGDPVAVFIDTLTGSVSSSSFKLWYRELG